MQIVKKLERRMRAWRRGVMGRRLSWVWEGEAWSGEESSWPASEGPRGESSVSESVCDIIEHCKFCIFVFFLDYGMGLYLCILINGQIDDQPFIPVSVSGEPLMLCLYSDSITEELRQVLIFY